LPILKYTGIYINMTSILQREKKEPLLDSSRPLRYFITDEEHRALPENTQLLFRNLPKSWWLALLIICYTGQQFFFMAIVKSGKEFGMLIGMLIMIVLGIESVGLGLKSNLHNTAHNYGSLMFISFLDILYVLGMTPAMAKTPALAGSVFLQTSIVARLIFMVFLSGHTFRNTHYLATIALGICITVTCVFLGSPSTAFLLGSLVIHAISQLFKIKYIRKHICSPISFNKMTLVISTVLGCAFTPLFLLMSQTNVVEYLSEGIDCIFGLECSGVLIYLICLLILTSLYHLILYKVRDI
jgi:hypothetical protein